MDGYSPEEFLEFLEVDIKNSEEKLQFLDDGGISPIINREIIEKNLKKLRLMVVEIKENNGFKLGLSKV